MKYFVHLELIKDEVIEAKSKKEAIKKLLKETIENWSEDDFYLHAMKYEDFLDLEGREEWQEKISMIKYFLTGMLAFAIAFTIYDITKTIEVRREIKRNKKLRQEKYEERVKKLNERHWKEDSW